MHICLIARIQSSRRTYNMARFLFFHNATAISALLPGYHVSWRSDSSPDYTPVKVYLAYGQNRHRLFDVKTDKI